LDTLGLNERQRRAIIYIKEHKKITSKEYAELFSITDRTARNDLKSLLDKKILIQRGTSKRLTYYELSIQRKFNGNSTEIQRKFNGNSTEIISDKPLGVFCKR
jgi:ATP-dependent DNA helicase RecG